jgi:signal transduction histidine kinase
MLQAQESERRRVCREMHDDLAQRVALMGLQIENMKQRYTAGSGMVPELDSLSGCVAMLADDVHRICYRLHPVVLDNLGLVRGIEFLCDEQTRTSGIKTRFEHGEIPKRLPGNVSLCLYRVVQEALQNVAKHGKTNEACVTLHTTRRGVQISVSDKGQGFDVKLVKAKSRLGLVFITERVKLLGGRCAIRSKPGKGTRILASVPLTGADDE